MATSITSAELEDLTQHAIDSYFNDCRARIPGFVANHFQYPGAWRTNREAFGWDLVRAPLNVLWAPIYGLVCIVRYLCARKGYDRTASLLHKCPEGFTTSVQKYLVQRLSDELLMLNCKYNALGAHISRALQQRFNETHPEIAQQRTFAKRVDAIVAEALLQYRVTRTASSDITNSITSTLIGAVAFNKFTPGGIGIGFVIAALIAQKSAEQSFFLGETLGRVYYAVFPPEPSLQLTLLSMTGVLALLAIVASFSGLLSDPVQARLGLHRLRLRRLIDHLERDFHAQTRSSFRPKDQYVARILDLFDAVKSQLL